MGSCLAGNPRIQCKKYARRLSVSLYRFECFSQREVAAWCVTAVDASNIPVRRRVTNMLKSLESCQAPAYWSAPISIAEFYLFLVFLCFTYPTIPTTKFHKFLPPADAISAFAPSLFAAFFIIQNVVLILQPFFASPDHPIIVAVFRNL